MVVFDLVKTMILIGAITGQSSEDFKSAYLDSHSKILAANNYVKEYVSNGITEPTQEMMDAGWGWGGADDSGILVIDEVWTDGIDVLSLYRDVNVIGAYECKQVILRPCYPKWPIGEKSHWIKRMGLLKCFDEQRPEDFFAYWEHIHGPKALLHHIGAGIYIQNHFVKTIKSAPIEWNGSVSLCYWNVDAFKYGHFSRPNSMDVIKEDGSHFMDVFKSLYAEEYVIKK